jgi:Cu-processing system permease protein
VPKYRRVEEQKGARIEHADTPAHRYSVSNFMNTIWALTGVVIKELYRRKDFYVLFVLTAVITLAAGSVRFFHDPNIVRYVKDLCLLLIWISALLITIALTARQIPAERESRTIFPLLAKPVTRGQVILGKFFGCWVASGFALLVFYVFFAVITGSREQNWPVPEYLQAFLLQWIMLGIVTAMTLLGSVIFVAPSSTITILFILVAGILFLGRHLNTVALHNAEPMRTIIYAIYFIIPHLELFDVRERVVNDWGLVNWLVCGLATLYAMAYTALFLLLTWLAFRRKSLT